MLKSERHILLRQSLKGLTRSMSKRSDWLELMSISLLMRSDAVLLPVR